MERWARPQLRLWLLLLLLPPAPGRQKESGGLPAGQSLLLGRRLVRSGGALPLPWFPGEAGGQLMLWPLERKAGERARGSLGAERESVWVAGAAFTAQDPGE